MNQLDLLMPEVRAHLVRQEIARAQKRVQSELHALTQEDVVDILANRYPMQKETERLQKLRSVTPLQESLEDWCLRFARSHNLKDWQR